MKNNNNKKLTLLQRNRGHHGQQYNTKHFNKNVPETNYYSPHHYYVQTISPIVPSAPLYYPYDSLPQSQITNKPRPHKPITLINPETNLPVLPAHDTNISNVGNPQNLNASPTLREGKSPSPVKSSANIDAQQKAKRSFMEQIKAKALAAQQEYKKDNVTQEQFGAETIHHDETKNVIEAEQSTEKFRSVDEKNKDITTQIAEEARLEEARLAETAQIIEKAQIAEEAQVTEKTQLAEELCTDEKARVTKVEVVRETHLVTEPVITEQTQVVEKPTTEDSLIAEKAQMTKARLAEEFSKREETRRTEKRLEHNRLEKLDQENLQKFQAKTGNKTQESKKDPYSLEKIAAMEETIKSKVKSLNHTIQSSITSQHRIDTAKRLTVSELLALKYPKGIKPNSITNKKNAFVYTVNFLKQFAPIVTFPPKENWADLRARVILEDLEPQRSHFTRQSSSRGSTSQNMGYFTSNFRGNTRITSSNTFQPQSANINRISSQSNFNVTSFSSIRSGQQSLPRRNVNNYFHGSPGAKLTSPKTINLSPMTPMPEPVSPKAPLKRTANAWTPKLRSKIPDTVNGLLTEEAIIRKSKSLLNKMTAENFDVISDQLLEISNQSENETTGLALRIVVNQTFEKATDEAHWSAVYAKFCLKLVEKVSPEVQQEGLLTKAGEPMRGFQLVRHYLLNKCQNEFEKGWKVKLPTNEDGTVVEVEMMSDEYYKIVAAKRRGLGLVRFIGELYILKLLTSKIINACFFRLLNDPEDETPSEEEIESACKLMTTVGPTFEEELKKKHGDLKQIMERFSTISKDKSLSSRFRFMIFDVIDMYKSGWTKAKKNDGPKSIAEIHEEERKTKLAAAATLSHSHRDHQSGSSGGRSNSSRNNTISSNDVNKLRKFHAPGSGGSPGGRGSLSPSASNSSSGGHSLGWNNSIGRNSKRSSSHASSSLGSGNNPGTSNHPIGGKSSNSTIDNGNGLASKQPSSRGGNSFAALANDDD